MARTVKRKEPTEAQRNLRSATTHVRRTHEEKRKTDTNKGTVLKDVADYKSGLRRKNYGSEHGLRRESRVQMSSLSQETIAFRAQQARETQHARQQERLGVIERNAQIRGRNKAIDYLAERPAAGDTEHLAAPNISFAGGVMRSIFIAIVLIVMYAAVTHSMSSAGAITNVGGVFRRFTSTEPLFVRKVGAQS